MTAVMIDCREACASWKISRRIKEGCRIQSFVPGNLGRSDTMLTARQAKKLFGRDRKPLSLTSVGDDGDDSKLHRRFSVSSVRLLCQLMIQLTEQEACRRAAVPCLACLNAALNTCHFLPRRRQVRILPSQSVLPCRYISLWRKRVYSFIAPVS